jgi:hypothetical protein
LVFTFLSTLYGMGIHSLSDCKDFLSFIRLAYPSGTCFL